MANNSGSAPIPKRERKQSYVLWRKCRHESLLLPHFPPSNYISNYESSVLLSGRSLTRQVPVTSERTLLHRGSFLFLLFMWHARESIRLSRNGAEHTCVHTVRLDSTANKNVSWREQREPINRKHNDFAKPLCFITSRHDILELRFALQPSFYFDFYSAGVIGSGITGNQIHRYWQSISRLFVIVLRNLPLIVSSKRYKQTTDFYADSNYHELN